MSTQSTSAAEKQILQQRITKAVANGTKNVQAAIKQIESDNANLKDLLVPNSKISFSANGSLYLNGVGAEPLKFSKHSTGQVADKLGIPVGYMRKLMSSEWGRQLAKHNLNELNSRLDSRFLVREVNGEVRGFMSDSYRRLNSSSIYMAYMQAAQANGGVIYDASHGTTKSYIETLHPDIIEIPTANNGVVNIVIGSQLRNSDFGDGALELKTYIMNVVCLSGMVSKKSFRKVHLGGTIADDVILSNKTMQLDTEHKASEVADRVGATYSAESKELEAARILKATHKELDFAHEVKQLPRIGVTKDESEDILATLLRANPEDGIEGKNTLWKFTQGITAVANKKDGIRKRELQEIASSLY